MTALVILVRKSFENSAFDPELAESISPYLARFGWAAETASAETFTELRAGESRDAIHSIRVTLNGDARVDVPTVAEKLVKHLRQYAKDTGLDVHKFEVLLKREN